MKVELLIIILSLLYISTYQNENITLNITELTDESFSNYTKQYEFTLLFFHSKNCIPCRKAMSSLRRANYYLQSLNPPRAIALIDIESNSTKDIQSRFPNQAIFLLIFTFILIFYSNYFIIIFFFIVLIIDVKFRFLIANITQIYI